MDLGAGLNGKHYNVGSGNIKILDKKTIEIPAFTFEGTKPPGNHYRSNIAQFYNLINISILDAWFFAGKYDSEGKVDVNTGHKLIIRGVGTQPA